MSVEQLIKQPEVQSAKTVPQKDGLQEIKIPFDQYNQNGKTELLPDTSVAVLSTKTGKELGHLSLKLGESRGSDAIHFSGIYVIFSRGNINQQLLLAPAPGILTVQNEYLSRAEIQKEAYDRTGQDETSVVAQPMGIRQGDIEGTSELIMEGVSGMNLSDIRAALRRIPDKAVRMNFAAVIIDKLRIAYQKLNREGIVHNDPSSGNIFFNQSGGIKFIDFGTSFTKERPLSEDKDDRYLKLEEDLIIDNGIGGLSKREKRKFNRTIDGSSQKTDADEVNKIFRQLHIKMIKNKLAFGNIRVSDHDAADILDTLPELYLQAPTVVLPQYEPIDTSSKLD